LRFLRVHSKSQRDLSVTCVIMSEVCIKHVHEKRHSFLNEGNARNSCDSYDEGIHRLVSCLRLRSFHSFPSGRIRNRHSWKGRVWTMRRSWRFCIVRERLLLCAENKEIVFTIWDAIWSLTRFRCSARSKKIYIVYLAIVFLNNTLSNKNNIF